MANIINQIIIGVLITIAGAAIVWIFAQVILLGKKSAIHFANQNVFMEKIDGMVGMIDDIRVEIAQVNQRLDTFLRSEIDMLKELAGRRGK